MKKATKFAALLFSAALFFTACVDDPVTPDPEPQPEPEPEQMELPGTGWEAVIDNQFTLNGTLQVNVNMLNTLDFFDETTGEMFTDFVMEVPDYPSANQSDNMTEAFTYTFDGTTLTLTSTEEGAEPGDLGTMTYNPADTTLVLEIPNETYQGINLRDVYGSDKMVFRKVH